MERRGLGSVALTLKDSVARRVELPELDHVVGRPNLEQIYFEGDTLKRRTLDAPRSPGAWVLAQDASTGWLPRGEERLPRKRPAIGTDGAECCHQPTSHQGWLARFCSCVVTPDAGTWI
eukprot:scaffold1806_cov240-Pinguiococcus_pyrenoidosus.AAC.15